MQERLRQLELRAVEVRAFSPTVVLGMLQTEGYASVVFGQSTPAADAPKAVAARRRRHGDLDDPARRWVLLHTEGALEWALGGPDVMVEQLAAISAVSQRPNVRLGVIPARTPATVVGLHPFQLHRVPQGWQAAVGTKDGTALITDEVRVGRYLALFAELEQLAVYDDEARGLLARVADDYRQDAL